MEKYLVYFSLRKGIFRLVVDYFRYVIIQLTIKHLSQQYVNQNLQQMVYHKPKQKNLFIDKEPQLTTIDLSEQKIVEDAVYMRGVISQFNPWPLTCLYCHQLYTSYRIKLQVQICFRCSAVGTGVKSWNKIQRDFFFIRSIWFYAKKAHNI